MKKLFLTFLVSGICMIGFAQKTENDKKATDQSAANLVNQETLQPNAPKITAQQQADAKSKIKANPNAKVQVADIAQPSVPTDAAENDVRAADSKAAPVKTETVVRQKQAPKE